ncbi:MAG: glycosyltransferase, partial [Salinibacterium sp.]|nr:glycosyltransferase [Salinibacterium sp.]
AVLAVIEQVQPTEIIVDHLAFSARLAMDAAGLSYADVVLGHPTALPVGAEVYGYPPVWPTAFAPDPAALAELRALCERVSENFTAEWNAALAELNPARPPSPSAFNEHGELLLLNYPAELASPERGALLPQHQFLGSAVRDEPRDEQVEQWLAASSEPFVYLSFGSFLSVRDDVLARVCSALRILGVRAAIATGSADAAALGPLSSEWLVRGFLPQVRLLKEAAAAVTHGGNNSITESMTHGVPLVVLPFSTDQFAAADAIERNGFGFALAPNTASVEELAEAIEFALHLTGEWRARLEALSASLTQVPGRMRARSALRSLRTN